MFQLFPGNGLNVEMKGMFQILHDIGVWQRLNFNWLAALAVKACPCGALSSFSSALPLRSLTWLNVEQAGEAILSIDVHGLKWNVMGATRANCALLTHHTNMCRYTYNTYIYNWCTLALIYSTTWCILSPKHKIHRFPLDRICREQNSIKGHEMQRWCRQSELRLRKVSVVSTCKLDQNRLALRLVSISTLPRLWSWWEHLKS